jgi:hypothetical protein
MKKEISMNNPIFKKLVTNICAEHYSIAKTEDSNLAYLWYMYVDGTKKGTFKPFMFIAECNLLKAIGLITEDEVENLLGMFKSVDEDNMYITTLSINTLRKKRIKDFGLYTKDNPNYSKLDYTRDVINTNVFMSA